MPEFTYLARKPDGSLVRGTLQANDRRDAIAQIEQQKGVPIKIEQATGTKPQSSSAPKPAASNQAPPEADAPASLASNTRIPIAQLFLFTEQLAHLLSAGMTLDEALGILVRRLQQPKLKGL